MKDNKPAFTQTQITRYHALVGEIVRRMPTVHEVLGLAMQVKEEGLYRLEFKTFDEFCKFTFGKSAGAIRIGMLRESRKLIAETTGESKPESKATVLQCNTLPGKVNETKENLSHPKPVAPPGKPAPVYDNEGNALKFEALKFWGRRGEVKALMDEFVSFRSTVEAMLDPKDPIWHEINFSQLDSRLDELGQILRAATPHAICTECGGAPSTRGGRCAMCGNKGLVSKTMWDRCVPEEKKRIMAAHARGAK